MVGFIVHLLLLDHSHKALTFKLQASANGSVFPTANLIVNLTLFYAIKTNKHHVGDQLHFTLAPSPYFQVTPINTSCTGQHPIICT